MNHEYLNLNSDISDMKACGSEKLKHSRKSEAEIKLKDFLSKKRPAASPLQIENEENDSDDSLQSCGYKSDSIDLRDDE